MARSATSGSNWTQQELLAFNIRVVDATAAAFFASADLPPIAVSPTILNNLNVPHAPLSKTERHFFQYLKLAEQSNSEDSAVGDFAACILRLLDYDDDDRFIRLSKLISFFMAGQKVDAKADVCVMNDLDYLLLVHEDKRQASLDDPEPQLIAGAIAAYYQNNFRRTRVSLPALPTVLMPGITMIGTAPVFYRIPVSHNLLHALDTSSYPEEETVVLRFVPPVPNKETYFSEGMRPLANRKIVLQCFAAFKASMVRNVTQSRHAAQV